ncbi:Delta-like protein 4 [Mactra antiquata]
MVLLVLPTIVLSGGTIEVGLMEFTYTAKENCDYMGGKCDPYFKVCVSNTSTSCSTKQVQTTAIDDQNRLTDIIQNNQIRPNPIKFLFAVLPENFTVFIEIWNENTISDDHVDTIKWTQLGYNNQSTNITLMGNKENARMQFHIKIQCEKHYYGPSCNISCVNSPHGTCLNNGTLVCDTGYTGRKCKKKVSTPITALRITTTTQVTSPATPTTPSTLSTRPTSVLATQNKPSMTSTTLSTTPTTPSARQNTLSPTSSTTLSTTPTSVLATPSKPTIASTTLSTTPTTPSARQIMSPITPSSKNEDLNHAKHQPSDDNKTPTLPIILGAAGGTILVVLAICVVIHLKRRKKQFTAVFNKDRFSDASYIPLN